MDLEVVGRHALLFDDDSMAAFVNSGDALVEWNSLQIDRYDVRHLLSAPLPPRRRRNPQQPSSSESSLETELDHERYLDLPQPSDGQEPDESSKPVDAGSYRAVGFSYGNTNDSADYSSADAALGNSGFCPPFPVPESLLQSLPPSEKVHQIIARTAMFVSKHGGQSEFILRVKQGDNPTFGFLMPDHHLHAYFRFLVDHPEVLQFDIDGKPQSGEQKTGTEHNQTDGVGGGALSLLGSVYGSGEDEDGASEDAPEYKEKAAAETLDALSATVSHGAEVTESRVNVATKDEPVYKHPFPSKEKAPVLKRNSFNSVSKAGITSSMRKDDTSGSLSAALDKLQASTVAMSKIEPVLLEPPSDLKRLVDKIVEFIMKNGKQFEAVLIEQDSKHGRFPFLLPSNQYHPYYLKLLQKAQESKSTGKSFLSEKDDSVKTSLSKASDVLSLETGGCDIPFDSDRKEKFKMVIGKSKKEGQDPLSKATQPQFGVSVDATAAAAILQAATRGMKYPNLDILSSTFPNGNRHDEGGREGSLPSSQPESVMQKSNQNAENSTALHVTKPKSKLAATEAASEANSSEAHLTKEQKLKAERLQRAKMFVAVLKNGAAPSKTEPLRGLSVEPQESGVSGFGAEVNLAAKEREVSSAPLAINTSDKNHKSERKNPGDEFNERRSRRKYRTRSGRNDDEEEEEEEEEKEEEEERERKHFRKKHRSHRSSHVEDDEDEIDEDDERDNKHSKKKHRSHRFSHADDGDESEEMDHKRSRRKHRSHRTSHEDEDKDKDERDHTRSRKKHRSSHSSHDEDDEEEDYKEGGDKKKHSSKKHRSHHSSHHSRDRHKKSSRHSSSKDRESRHLHESDSSTHEEHQHHDKSDKQRKRSHSDREELEEGEISSKISDQSRGSVGVGASREASVDLSSYRDRRGPSQASEATEVSEDLRAKIRAMLMATL